MWEQSDLTRKSQMREQGEGGTLKEGSLEIGPFKKPSKHQGLRYKIPQSLL